MKSPPGELARGLLAMLAFDETSSLGNIPLPMLLVPGDRDPLTLPAASEHIASVVRAAALAPLADAKHMGLIEHHDRFDALLAAFIEQHAAVAVRAR